MVVAAGLRTSVPPTSEPAEIADSFPPVEDASRIIPVNGDIAEVVYALDLGDQIVATDISATYPDEANDTPTIGYQRTLTAETILAFEPTVVIADDRAGPPEVFDSIRAARAFKPGSVPARTRLAPQAAGSAGRAGTAPPR